MKDNEKQTKTIWAKLNNLEIIEFDFIIISLDAIPDMPAFCQSMELIASSKSSKVSLNHFNPSTQLILR